MNVNPGGKQTLMRITVWQGRVHKMNYYISKGMHVILQERGIDTSWMVADDMRTSKMRNPSSSNT